MDDRQESREHASLSVRAKETMWLVSGKTCSLDIETCLLARAALDKLASSDLPSAGAPAPDLRSAPRQATVVRAGRGGLCYDLAARRSSTMRRAWAAFWVIVSQSSAWIVCRVASHDPPIAGTIGSLR